MKERAQREKELKWRKRKPRQITYPVDATDQALRDGIVKLHEYVPPEVLIEAIDEIYANFVRWKEGTITSKKGWLRTREQMYRCHRFIYSDF